MLPEAQEQAIDLMEKIKCYTEPELIGNRLQWAAELGDLFQVPGEAQTMSDLLDNLVEFVIPNEPDPKVIDELFRALEYGFRYSSVDVNLDPLVSATAPAIRRSSAGCC